MDINSYRGELAALTSALLWALGATIFTRLGQRVPPLALNLLKGIAAIAFVLLTLWLRGDRVPAADGITWGLLAVSGICGISFGDTLFFAALNRMGPRRTLLLQTASPLLSALLAWIFLREPLGPLAGLGIVLVMFGVAGAISERSPPDVGAFQFTVAGVSFALGAALAQAVGAVLSRAALAETAIAPLWATLVRLLAGEVVLLLGWGWQQRGKWTIGDISSPRAIATIAGTAFYTTYLAIWLQQTSLKFAPAGISQTLSATSPILILPLVAILGERVSWRAIGSAIVAFAGVACIFWR